jgi:putative ABC transport system substrate-binding protein
MAMWPTVVRAQQPSKPVVGYLSARSPDDTEHLVKAFREGLGKLGFVDGDNVAIEYKFALGQYDRLPQMAVEFVRDDVSVLTTTGGEPAAFAARAATSKIPIVFVVGGDPIKEKLAASFNRPSGNATGITLLTNLLEPKRLGLMRELIPSASSMGFLLNPSFPQSEDQLADAQAAARAINLSLHLLRADTDDEIDAAFETVRQQRIAAIVMAASPFFDTRREKLVTLAAKYRVPMMYHFREYVVAGGLLSYGIDSVEVYRQAGVYTGRVLRGVPPADLPVMQANRFEFVINLKAAKELGVNVPQSLLARADEVIE